MAVKVGVIFKRMLGPNGLTGNLCEINMANLCD